MAGKKEALKIIAQLLVVCVTSTVVVTALNYCPSTEFLGNGYNVIKGNPLSQTTDPGFQFEQIYQQTYSNNNTQGLGCLIPDDITLITTPSCSYTSEFVSATSAYDYQQSLQKQVTLSESAGFWIFKESFTASETFKSWFNDENNSSSAYLTSVASCTAYFAELPSFVWNPQFTPNFIGGVAQLSNDTAFEFVEAFGTHYVSSMHMGGNSLFYYEFEQQSWSSLSQKYSSSEIAGGVELGLYAHVGGSTSGSQYSSVQQDLEQQSTSSGFWGIPFPAPQCSNASCDPSEWASKIQLPGGNPFPQQYTLKPITDFLTSEYFPDDDEIQEKQEMLIQYLNGTYCGDVSGCFFPVKPNPPPFKTAPQVSAGAHHTCGLISNGTVVCWGCSGFGANYGQCNVPEGLLFIQISAGDNHVCGLIQNGTAICWGDNGNGQCNVPNGVIFRRISAGSQLTCGLLTNYTEVCWGWNAYGQLNVPGGLDFSQISTGTGYGHACALLSNGEPVCWGWNVNGEDNIPPGLVLQQISAGGDPYGIHSCGLMLNGQAVCWGCNAAGQTNVPPGLIFSQISCGAEHTCGLLENGQVTCWGVNNFGQINVPPGLTFSQISANMAQTCGLMANGEIVCWGCGAASDYGQCNVPPIIF